jgi:transcriptional repressor NrdR
MRCPNCGSLDDLVVNNRHKEDHTIIRRRRECAACNHRWTTYELHANALKRLSDGDERNEDLIKLLEE